MKRIVIVFSLVAMLFVGFAANASAAGPCGSNDYACQAQSWVQGAQSWGRQVQRGVQGFSNATSNGGFWNNGLSNGWTNTPSVPGAGTVFGRNAQQWMDSARRFNGR
jgi:hypothetical protein